MQYQTALSLWEVTLNLQGILTPNGTFENINKQIDFRSSTDLQIDLRFHLG